MTNPSPAVGSCVPGHGTAGIVERAELFGGAATIGGREDRWVVDVTLPLPGSAA